TGAERRNAMRGPIPKLIRKLALHKFFRSRISFDTRRMQEYNTVAKILLIESKGRFVDTKARNLDTFVKDSARDDIASFKEVRASLEKLCRSLVGLLSSCKAKQSAQCKMQYKQCAARNDRIAISQAQNNYRGSSDEKKRDYEFFKRHLFCAGCDIDILRN